MLIEIILKVVDSQSSMEEKDNFDYWKQSNLENHKDLSQIVIFNSLSGTNVSNRFLPSLLCYQ